MCKVSQDWAGDIREKLLPSASSFAKGNSRRVTAQYTFALLLHRSKKDIAHPRRGWPKKLLHRVFARCTSCITLLAAVRTVSLHLCHGFDELTHGPLRLAWPWVPSN
jgi:hypothetical protein